MNQVQIFSNRTLIEFFQSELKTSVVRISITDFKNDEHLFISGKNIEDSLCLSFCDVTQELVDNNSSFSIFKNHLFTEEQAEQVLEFVIKNIDLPFIINCTMGISRSAAVAKIVCLLKSINSAWISPPNYNPNPFVYEILIKTLLENTKKYEMF